MADAAACAAPSGEEDETSLLPSLESLFESTIDAICPFGDVILVVKDEFLPTAKFQVSSCILAMSSKVFTVLFSKNFAEGQSICSRRPGEALEVQVVDSPIAMKHFLRMLHHKGPLDAHRRGEHLSTSALLDLAIVIDKYDSIEALRLPADALLGQYVGSEAKNRLDHLITAAYMLDQPKHFRNFTKELVMSEIMVQAKHFEKKCLELLPTTLLQSLFSQQSIACQEITVQITTFIKKFSDACKVASRQLLVLELLDELNAVNIWPMVFSEYSIRDLCAKIEVITIPTISIDDKVVKIHPGCSCNSKSVTGSEDEWDDVLTGRGGRRKHCGWGCDDERTSTEYIRAPPFSALKDMSTNVQELVVGVCLDCIRDPPRECRKRHRYYWPETASRTARVKIYEYSDGGSIYTTMDIDDGDDYDVQMSGSMPGYWDDAW